MKIVLKLKIDRELYDALKDEATKEQMSLEDMAIVILDEALFEDDDNGGNDGNGKPIPTIQEDTEVKSEFPIKDAA